MEKINDSKQTVEEKEVSFIKELFVVILAIGLIVFLTITVIVGTFLENTFFRKILTFFSSDDVISIEDKIRGSGFGFSCIVVLLILILNQIGSKTKTEILKKTFDSRKSIQIYILIGFLLFAVVFWEATAMLLIGFAFILAILGISILLGKIKKL